MSEFHPGDRVKWVGRLFAYPGISVTGLVVNPGYEGVVDKTARHDPQSVKVIWDERQAPGYTWERAANLRHSSDPVGVAVLVG